MAASGKNPIPFAKLRLSPFAESVISGVLGGIIATVLIGLYSNWKTDRQEASRYQVLKASAKEACTEFRRGVLQFAGPDDSVINNIHSVPDFPFGLLHTIQGEHAIFVKREGDDFMKVMNAFSRMEEGFRLIQQTKQDPSQAVSFRWETATWYSYYTPASVVCNGPEFRLTISGRNDRANNGFQFATPLLERRRPEKLRPTNA